MKNTLNFSVAIQCPLPLVWDTMLSQDGYQVWTAAFAEGSYFSGSWEKGQKIQFLTPKKMGMVAVIAENRPHEFVSIKHIGEISAGVEDTSSEKVRAWAPAYENYSFTDTKDGTELKVSLEAMIEYQDFMKETFPLALSSLKILCESRAQDAA